MAESLLDLVQDPETLPDQSAPGLFSDLRGRHTERQTVRPRNTTQSYRENQRQKAPRGRELGGNRYTEFKRDKEKEPQENTSEKDNRKQRQKERNRGEGTTEVGARARV